MKIEYSTQKIGAASNAVKIDPSRDINYYETLSMFCADNDINLNDVSDAEFESHVNDLSKFGFGWEGPDNEFYFWVVSDVAA